MTIRQTLQVSSYPYTINSIPFRKINETISTKPIIHYIGTLNSYEKNLPAINSIAICAQLLAQSKAGALPPALSAIRGADLKKDIYELAGDAFRGRRAGTIDEMRAAAWVAQKAHGAGLKPAGEDGTYFQFFNINRTRTPTAVGY